MVGVEALKALKNGKIIRRKDNPKFEHMYTLEKNTIPVSTSLNNYMTYTVFMKDDDPLDNSVSIPMDVTNKGLMTFTNFNLFSVYAFTLLMENDTLDIWEIYIPLFDWLDKKGYNNFKASIIMKKNRLIKELLDKYYDIDVAKKFFAEYITDILYFQTKRKPDNNIIKFIEKFSLSFGNDVYDDVFYPLFTSGYCYYFANMLKEAFGEGKVCLCYPFGHIVYVKDYIPYDITGKYDGEAELFIPIEYLDPKDISNFKHASDEVNKFGDEYRKAVTDTFCDDFLRNIGFGNVFEDALKEENKGEK